MKTFQDYEKVMNNEEQKKDFILEAIQEYKSSTMYQEAIIGEDYYKERNTEIMNMKKWIRNHLGQKMEDVLSPNNKMASSYFNEDVVFYTNYILGNGVIIDDETKDKFDKKFDYKIQNSFSIALRQGVAYGFKNVGKIDVLKATEFVPLLDEYNGSLRAGIRFWQLDSNKPLNVELFQEDGFSKYSQLKGKELTLTQEKRAYKTTIKKDSLVVEIDNQENYSTLPIKMLFCNEYKQNDLIGKKELIDLYDRVSSDFANDFDSFSQLYWVLKNCGGMTNADLIEFKNRVAMLNVVAPNGQDEGVSADLKQTEIPHTARQVFLEILEKRIYKAFSLIDFSNVTNATATEIKSNYIPIDMKADNLEYFIIDFIEQLFQLDGVEEPFTFKRNKLVNENETTQMILSASNYLDEETIVELLPFIPTDKLEEIKKRINKEKDERIKEMEAELEEAKNQDVENIEENEEEQ